MLVKKDNVKVFARDYAGEKGFRLGKSFYRKLTEKLDRMVEKEIRSTISEAIPRAKGHKSKTIYEYDM